MQRLEPSTGARRTPGAPGAASCDTRPIEPLGLHHVSINVDDVPAALDFYVNALGLRPRADRAAFSFDGAWLDLGAQQLHLLAKPVPKARGQHFAIAVADLDATVGELRAKGVEVSDPVPVGARRQAFLHDPSGNLVELQELPAGRH